MVRARVSPYCLVVMALVAICLSTAKGRENKTWLESLRHCQQQGRQLATPSNGGLNSTNQGIFWVGAMMSLTEWLWGKTDPLYRYKGCQLQVEGQGHELGLANEAGACFDLCPDKRFVALKGTKCYCLDNDDTHVESSVTCEEMCYRNTNNTCGGQNSYSVYELNLLNKDNHKITMRWSSGHETAAIFETSSNSLWKILPKSKLSEEIYTYCCRSATAALEHRIKTVGYQENLCAERGFEVVTFPTNSSCSFQISNRRLDEPRNGWIFLSRRQVSQWLNGNRADWFPAVKETEPEPQCGTLSQVGAERIFSWRKCSDSLPFLCSPAAPGGPTQTGQSEGEDLNPIYLAIAGAGGALVLIAFLVTICLCRRKTSRGSSGSKTDRQMASQRGHVTFDADVTGGSAKTPGGAVNAEYMNAPAGSTKRVEFVEDEFEGNYACVDDPSKASALPVQKEVPAGSTKKIELVEDDFEGNYACVDDPPKASALPVQKEASAGSSTKKVAFAEDELEGNYACVDDPPKASALPFQKEAASVPSPSPASAAADADSCMYAVVQKPANQNASAQQKAGPEKATPPLDKQEVKPLEELYACVKK